MRVGDDQADLRANGNNCCPKGKEARSGVGMSFPAQVLTGFRRAGFSSKRDERFALSGYWISRDEFTI